MIYFDPVYNLLASGVSNGTHLTHDTRDLGSKKSHERSSNSHSDFAESNSEDAAEFKNGVIVLLF